jgi:DNA-binding MarR family transcriptional regulator
MLSIIHLRERELARALASLGPADLMVLLKLVILADAGTGIAHVRAEDLATELVLDPQFVTRALERLAARDFLEELTEEADTEFVELGPVLVRRGNAPPNLPLGQTV